LWDVAGLKILVDPILVGNLDFGIPWLYDAAKKVLKNFQVFFLVVITWCVPSVMYMLSSFLFVELLWALMNLFLSVCNLVQLSDLPEIDCLLITQSLDDHCHLKTLKPLSGKSPNLRVIATPNAKPLLDPLFRNVCIFPILVFLPTECSYFV
jgi:L-ascorbate metabolism protein UlaG (beta-lactamase superfamily)